MSAEELEARLGSAQRTNRFRLLWTLPAGVTGNITDLELLAKSAVIPGKTKGTITVNRLGRLVRLTGDEVTTESFPVSLYIPTNGTEVVNAFNSWYALNGADAKVTMRMQLLNVDNSVNITYELKGVRITSIDDLSLSHDDTDTILEIPCTFGLDFINPV